MADDPRDDARLRTAQILLTGHELGLFRQLADGPRSVAELADQTGSRHPAAMDRLLNAATALGLLVKAGDRFANSPLASETGDIEDGEGSVCNGIRRPCWTLPGPPGWSFSSKLIWIRLP